MIFRYFPGPTDVITRSWIACSGQRLNPGTTNGSLCTFKSSERCQGKDVRTHAVLLQNLRTRTCTTLAILNAFCLLRGKHGRQTVRPQVTMQ
eukprot:346513-Chlamydomonas_euryale.AAC.1